MMLRMMRMMRLRMMMLRDVTGEDDNAEDDHEKDDNVDVIRRNCAIEMHVNMSQETSEEPL